MKKNILKTLMVFLLTPYLGFTQSSILITPGYQENSGISNTYHSFYKNNIYKGYVGAYTNFGNDLDFGSGSGNLTSKVHLTIGAIPKLTLLPTGFLGLGIQNPTTNLQIHQATAGAGSFLQLSNADVGFAAGNGLKIGINPNTLFISKNATIINQENSFLSLGTNNQTLMNFTANQRIGIGAANIAPVGVVDIHHTSTAAAPHFNLRTLSDGAPNLMRFENSNGTRSFIQSYYLGSATAANNYFDLTYGSNILTTITGDGRFGINNLNPSDLLHLSPISATGDVFTRISSTTGLTGLRLQNNGGDWAMYTNETNNMFIGYSTNNFSTTNEVINLFPNAANFELKPAVNNQVFLGTSANRWREIWSVNALNTSSDRRLKKNITEIKYGLKEVLKLSAVTYNWKNNEDTKLHLGFIAQDVAEIVPEIVSKSGISDAEFEKLQKEGKTVTDTYGMQYTSLIPVLVKAIQEQQEIIDAKSIKISKLEEKLKTLENLEARLSQLESNALNNKPALLKSDK